MADDGKRTPLFSEHEKLGAKLVPFAGYQMPIQYSGIVREHEAVRQRAGLFDVCHMGELELYGPDAVKVVNQLVTNDLERIAEGQAMYTCCCNDQGGILDDLIIYKHAPNRLFVVCNASNRDKISKVFSARAGDVCRDISDETALIALQGPKSLEILKRGGIDIDAELASFRFTQYDLLGVPCTVARTGYTGEDGVEMFCSSERASELWTKLLREGQTFGILPCGLGARDTLRLEARLSLYGNDIDETTNPLEAGLGWTVKFDKPDFVGKAALERVRERGLTRRLVGFEMKGRGVARHGYDLLDLESKRRGTCTSGSPSPTLGKAIGLGYLPIEMKAIGTQFFVDCRGKKIPAEVVKTPFYRRPQQPS